MYKAANLKIVAENQFYIETNIVRRLRRGTKVTCRVHTVILEMHSINKNDALLLRN